MENKEARMRILTLLGNPNPESFGAGLASAYASGAAEAGAEVQLIQLGELQFSPILDPRDRQLGDGGKQGQDIAKAREAILWAEHLTFVYPIWWAGTPALLKGFLDVTFLSGFSHQRQGKSPFPKRLLKGRSARCIETMGAPVWWYRSVYRMAAFRQMKAGTLEFCGVKPVRHTPVGRVREMTPAQRTIWLEKVARLGAQDAKGT